MSTMTLTEAYGKLRAHWPGRSFKIGVEVWYHDHGSSPPVESCEWSIWDEQAGTHRKGSTLESALAIVLGQGQPLDLETVDAQIEGWGLPSEREDQPGLPLTVVRS